MRASRGFTLIELMVVMVIISVLIGLAVLSTGFASTSRELDSEAERLAGLIGVLTDEAVLDNREYGLRLERDAYQVLRYDEAKARWLPVARDSHRLPEWAELTFELDGQPLVLAGSKGEKEQKKRHRPAAIADPLQWRTQSVPPAPGPSADPRGGRCR
ncbi:general secretion pathway protein H [Pseudomonas aeruginosa]|nr:general secretion pathway protein H [Pseudomonas aeruginosa]